MRRRAAALLLLALAATLAGTGTAGPAAGGTEASRFTLRAAAGGSFLVHGVYPPDERPCVDRAPATLHARYPGSIEVGRAADGSLFVIGEMGMEEYLQGIAEMPATWPAAALQAQVIAARSYALARLSSGDSTGRELGYDLCATDACQVYRGLGVADGPYGARWRGAVAATAGRALLYEGRPADALYFSTSNGRTYGNDEVFGSAPLPYLRPITERDDGASPLSHWSVRLPLGDVARFLHAAGSWPGGALTSVRRSGSNMVLAGAGSTRTISVASFRTGLNAWASCLAPERYPTVNPGGGRLPQTVPSIWFSTTSAPGAVVLAGRGWGHGVGMVQWGAYGRARRGLSAGDILAAYYGGLRPTPVSEPASIRIGLAVGLRTLRIAADGPVTVAGRTLPPGPWLVTGGKALRVVHGTAPPTFVDPGSLTAVKTARAGREATATLSLPATSVASLVLQVGAREIPVSSATTHGAGTTTVRWTPPPVATGDYRLQAIVTDGVDRVRTKPVAVHLVGTAPPEPLTGAAVADGVRAAPATRAVPSPSPTPSGGGLGSALPLLLSALAAVAVGALSIRFLARRFARPPGRDDHEPGAPWPPPR